MSMDEVLVGQMWEMMDIFFQKKMASGGKPKESKIASKTVKDKVIPITDSESEKEEGEASDEPESPERREKDKGPVQSSPLRTIELNMLGS